MNMFKKIIYITSLLASMIFASPAPAAPKVEITPQDWPELCYKTRAKSITCTRDYSFGALSYNIQASENEPILGVAYSTFDLTIYWDKNGLTGYKTTNKKVEERFNLSLIEQRAKKHNIPNWLSEAGTRAHERQHAKDHKNFNLLNFKGFDTLDTDKTEMIKRRAEISDRMEARAMAAGLEGMKKAIKEHITEISRDIKKIQREQEKLKKLEEQLLVHLNAIKEGNNKKILPEKKLSKLVNHIEELQHHSSDWDKNMAELNLKLTEYNNLLQNAEALMLRMSGTTPIIASGTLYVDAYNMYIKQGNMKNDEVFAEFINSQNAALEAYFEESIRELKDKKIASPYTRKYNVLPKEIEAMDFEITILDDSNRPVCRPCMVGDTMGTCKHPWCKNRNNKHSRYVREKGDYIPMNYDTLEPPKNRGNKY